MNGKLKTTATAFLLAAMIPTVTVRASGIPTFDGANAANALQQLMNWKARFETLVRDKLSQITGAKQFLTAYQDSQMNNLFQKRMTQCETLRKNNPTSANLCTNTVKLEQQKYSLLKTMNQDITAEFAKINGLISKQGSHTSQSGMLGAISGMSAVQTPSGTGKAESAEQDVQAQLQGVLAKIGHYETQFKMLDQSISQLKWARKQLTKDQLAGSNSKTTAAIASGIWLKSEAMRLNRKADRLRNENAARVNRF